jgi:hypothetical protein
VRGTRLPKPGSRAPLNRRQTLSAERATIIRMTEGSTFRFLLTCIGAPKCNVFFEPEGAEVELASGDLFTVEIAGPQLDGLEISFVPDGIIVGAHGARTRAWNRAGNELQL